MGENDETHTSARENIKALSHTTKEKKLSTRYLKTQLKERDVSDPRRVRV